MPTTVITGANRGIGLELVRQCLNRGDFVIAGCRNPSEASDLQDLNPQKVLPVDVSDEASVERFGKALDIPIDTLINNAGSSSSNLGIAKGSAGVLEAPMDKTLDLIRVNGLSAALVTRSLLPHLSPGARVVNVSSQIGSMVVGANFDDLPYAASKAVMNIITVQLATQLRAKEIVVCAFHPGWVRTDMGGNSADISVEESATGMLKSIEHLTAENTGSFLRWDGSTHPW